MANDHLRPDTHGAIERGLCGEPVELAPGFCVVELTLVEVMKADDHGLVHGGFVFGAADHAAMLAVNEPTVVLGGAEVRFLRPSRVGDKLRFEAALESREGRKRKVQVVGRAADGTAVFSGSFSCFVPERHVLGE